MHLAPRTLTFAVENFDSMIEEFRPLAQRHWEEIALNRDTIPLDPDWEMYRRADAGGFLRCYSVRLNGALIGYSVFFLVPRHPHYNHRWANNDIIRVAPEHRDGRVGLKLCLFAEQDLQKDGPIVVNYHTKIDHPALGRLLSAVGYGLIEHGYSKRLG